MSKVKILKPARVWDTMFHVQGRRWFIARFVKEGARTFWQYYSKIDTWVENPQEIGLPDDVLYPNKISCIKLAKAKMLK